METEGNIVCRCCGKTCEEPTANRRPTWFGSYERDKLVEAICIDCWEKGERWDKKRKV